MFLILGGLERLLDSQNKDVLPNASPILVELTFSTESPIASSPFLHRSLTIFLFWLVTFYSQDIFRQWQRNLQETVMHK